MGRFKNFFTGLSNLTPPRGTIRVLAIPESSTVLCEECHHYVAISGFIPHLSGEHNECPNCHCNDPAKLKYAAAWMRTEDEQRAHWVGRKLQPKRFVKAINDGVPKRIIKESTPPSIAHSGTAWPKKPAA